MSHIYSILNATVNKTILIALRFLFCLFLSARLLLWHYVKWSDDHETVFCFKTGILTLYYGSKTIKNTTLKCRNESVGDTSNLS